MAEAFRPWDEIRLSAKLPSLDAGRFAAALLVTLFHATLTVVNFGQYAPFGGILRGGHAGVEYFFVLSGFIIYYAHRRDLSHPAAIVSYGRKRATRILPMLWLILIPWGIFRVVLAGETSNAPTSLSTIVLDMLLLPHAGPLVLGVTWTLQRELIFYFLFAVAVLNQRIGLVVLAAWQVGVIGNMALRLNMGPWGTAFFDVANLGFGAGLLIAVFHERLRIAQPLAMAGAGAVFYVVLLVVEWRISGPMTSDFRPLGAQTGTILYTGAAAIGILGLIAHDRRGGARESRLVAALGGCSYVLYLVHGPVGSVLIRAARPLRLSPEMTMIMLTVVPVLVALALHLWVEKPILQALRPSSRARYPQQVYPEAASVER